MDKISAGDRSRNMSRIRGKDTRPELLIRRELWRIGLRYRLHYGIHGRPDLVFLKKKIAIFVNGCFWHGHGCKNDHPAKSNSEYWRTKIAANKCRDKKNRKLLGDTGWRVIVIWECDIEKDIKMVIDRLIVIYRQKRIPETLGEK